MEWGPGGEREERGMMLSEHNLAWTKAKTAVVVGVLATLAVAAAAIVGQFRGSEPLVRAGIGATDPKSKI